MTLREMIRRRLEQLNRSISEYNEVGENLNALRGADAPDQAAVDAAVSRRAELAASIETQQASIAELEREADQDEQVQRAAEERHPTAVAPEVRIDVSETNPVYRRGDNSSSYFRDLFFAGTTSPESHQARERLSASQETRALSTAAGAGGQFAPPEWLVEEYIALARAGRVAADLVQHGDLPGGISSINIPKVSGGASVAVVQTQNTAVSNTDITTTSVASNITTISGQQVVSIQLLRQSGIALDDIILGDLALAYATQLDVQVLAGSGANGQLAGFVTSGTTVTFTTSAPAVVSTTAAASFYNKVLNAVNAVSTTRYLPADAILMHPRRWAWVLAALDGSNRPLVVPNGPIFNNLGVTGEPVAEGAVGTLAGLPVHIDANIATDIGASTNQDRVYVIRRGDSWLWETPVEQSTWEATYANQNSVLFRVLGFSAFIARYAGSIQVIDGTGLTAPSL